MTVFEFSDRVEARADDLFDYLRKAEHYAEFIPEWGKPRPHDRRDGGSEAWVETDEAELRLRWGLDGPYRVHGYLDVVPKGEDCRVVVCIDTDRPHARDAVIRDLHETLESIQRIAEEEVYRQDTPDAESGGSHLPA